MFFTIEYQKVLALEGFLLLIKIIYLVEIKIPQARLVGKFDNYEF